MFFFWEDLKVAKLSFQQNLKDFPATLLDTKSSLATEGGQHS